MERNGIMNWKDKRVIVTGGAGVIGRVLIRMLLNKGAVIRSYDKHPSEIQLLANAKLCNLNNMHFNEFKDFYPDYIFHLAASFERSTESQGFWDINYNDNIVAAHKTINAAKLCKDLKKFVFASSYLVYEPMLYMVPYNHNSRSIAIVEGDAIGPRNLCGAAKYYVEKELDLHDLLFSSITVSARIFRVYGRGSKDVVSRWIRESLRGQKPCVFNLRSSFDYVFADDVAKGLIRLAETNEFSGQVNFGTGISTSIQRITDILQKELKALFVCREMEAKENLHYEKSVADIKKLRDTINWSPDTSIETGIKKVIEYERDIL